MLNDAAAVDSHKMKENEQMSQNKRALEMWAALVVDSRRARMARIAMTNY